MIELKPCPFCGGKARLKRLRGGYKTNPTTAIFDSWQVVCQSNCCRTSEFEDEIYHADNGEVVVKHNGAEEAAETWNKRV
ncbi:MAG: Lar family restriction alleviation protein [Oscillospiraceae bacterium]|nr:Lar family restriction alleviation protein [Oscillospiraceae bacterium]